MPLYYCMLLTIFKGLTTRGNLLAIVGVLHLNILQVFPYGEKRRLLHWHCMKDKKRNNPGILLSVFTINKRSAIAYYHCFPDQICLIWTVYINVRWMLHLICWLYPILIIYVNGEVFYKKFIKHICFMIIIVYLHRKLKIIFNKTRKLSSFT